MSDVKLTTRVAYLDKWGVEVEDWKEARSYRLHWDSGRGELGMDFETSHDARQAETLIHSFYKMGRTDAQRELRNAVGIRDWGGDLSLS